MYIGVVEHGTEFYVGVLAEFNQTHFPSILVSNGDTETANFTLLLQDPHFEISATVENGSVVSVPLPQPTPSTLIDTNRAIMGASIKTNQPSLKVFLSPDESDIFPVFSCESSNSKKENTVLYSYHMFPAVLSEQPLTRSTLLLVGCADATAIQIFSTDMLSLPVSLNATTTRPVPPSDSVATSFLLDEMENAAFLLTGEISKTYVLSNKPLTVTLVSTGDCIRSSGERSTTPCGSSYSQISPSHTWGRRFLVSSRPGSHPGAEYMIQTGLSESTSFTITCSNSTHTNTHSLLQELSLEKLSSFVLKIPHKHYCSIDSRNPVQVVQYSLREPTGVNTVFPLLIPPTEQYDVINSAILPLLPPSEDVSSPSEREFQFYATFFVPVLTGGEEFGAERKKVLVNGELVPGDWNNVFCRNSKLCGYVIDILLPLQSSVNISHEQLDVPFGVVIHRDGFNPFSYSAGFQLYDLTGLTHTIEICTLIAPM